MSLKIFMYVDTLDESLEGYVYNNKGYEIVELLQKALKEYNLTKVGVKK